MNTIYVVSRTSEVGVDEYVYVTENIKAFSDLKIAETYVSELMAIPENGKKYDYSIDKVPFVK